MRSKSNIPIEILIMKQDQITRHIIDANVKTRIGSVECEIRKRIVHELHILRVDDAKIEARRSLQTHVGEDVALEAQTGSELLQVDLELSGVVENETGKAERAEVDERDLFGEEDGSRASEEGQVGERVAMEHELFDELEIEVEARA